MSEDHRGSGSAISVRQRPRLALGLVAGVFGAAAGAGRQLVAGQESRVAPVSIATVDALPAEVIPPELGQAEFQVYVPETGHSVRGTMLDYWRATGAASVYGLPISEPFASSDGRYSQAFENAILQFRPDVLWTDDPTVRLFPLGQTAMRARLGAFGADGRRTGGGGDRRDFAFRPVDPNGGSAANAWNSGGIYVEATGHTLTGEFLAFWQANEGWFYLGNPISQPFLDRGKRVQYFDGGLLVSDGETARLAPLGRELAAAIGIDTAPIDGSGMTVFDETVFLTSPNPIQQFDPYAPGSKRIEVDIAKQQLLAYQGDSLVLSTLVSTGLKPNDTELGRFHVRIKYPKQDMGGFTDSTGEVVSVGDDPTPDAAQPGIRYDVEDVPDVMYINYDAEALHGAYWHENFGNRMSHGCINLPVEVSAFLYGWAPLGTQVWTHDDTAV